MPWLKARTSLTSSHHHHGAGSRGLREVCDRYKEERGWRGQGPEEGPSGLSERVLELGKKSWLHLKAFLWKEKVERIWVESGSSSPKYTVMTLKVRIPLVNSEMSTPPFLLLIWNREVNPTVRECSRPFSRLRPTPSLCNSPCHFHHLSLGHSCPYFSPCHPPWLLQPFQSNFSQLPWLSSERNSSSYQVWSNKTASLQRKESFSKIWNKFKPYLTQIHEILSKFYVFKHN